MTADYFILEINTTHYCIAKTLQWTSCCSILSSHQKLLQVELDGEAITTCMNWQGTALFTFGFPWQVKVIQVWIVEAVTAECYPCSVIWSNYTTKSQHLGFGQVRAWQSLQQSSVPAVSWECQNNNFAGPCIICTFVHCTVTIVWKTGTIEEKAVIPLNEVALIQRNEAMVPVGPRTFPRKHVCTFDDHFLIGIE